MTARRRTPAPAGRPDGPPRGGVLFFLTLPPAEDEPSGVVFRRHLTGFASAGIPCAVAAPPGTELPGGAVRVPVADALARGPDAWQSAGLSRPVETLRRWRALRGTADRAVGRAEPRGVVTFVDGPHPLAALAAASAARRAGVPAVALLHDDPSAGRDRLRGWAARRGLAAVAARARVAAVSEPLREVAVRAGGRRADVTVLRPMPGDDGRPFAGWREDYRRPTIVYAGKLYSGLAPGLRRVAAAAVASGGRLIVICGEPPAGREERDALAALPGVTVRPFFATSRQCRDFLRERAAAVYVGHPTRHAALAASFPSKLADYAQLGLPMLVSAPPEGALGRWLADHEWSGNLSPDARDADTAVRRLATPNGWAGLAEETRRAAAAELSAAAIHRRLCELLGLAGPAAGPAGGSPH